MITILLPVYNAENTIEVCLRSIVRQRFTNWQCVIVNDGSSDESAKIAAAFLQNDSRFQLIDRPHQGLVPALNTGIQFCNTAFVARMDADDIMHSTRLGLQVQALQEDQSLAAVGCQVRLFPRSTLKSGLRNYESWLNGLCSASDIRRDAFIECPVAHPGLMIRTSVLREFSYRDQGWPEDYDLVLRMLLAGKNLANLPARLLSWRNEASRMSRTDPVCGLDRFFRCKAHFLCQGFLKQSEHYILWGYGKTGRLLSRELLKLGRRPSHIIELHPGRIGNIIIGAQVVLPKELPHLPKKPVVVSVAKKEPRSLVRKALNEMGFVEIEDFLCTA
jgi:glycosyltransferase involved in cell wall biosynthesis